MALFRKKNESGSAPDALVQARSRHPSSGGAGTTRSEPLRSLVLTPTDWSQIGDMLSQGAAAVRPVETDERLMTLQRVISELRAFVTDQRTVGATYVRDWLLDVWSIAHSIDADVAQPAETLLTRLVGRDLVTADEIRETCEDTERAATAGRSPYGAG